MKSGSNRCGGSYERANRGAERISTPGSRLGGSDLLAKQRIGALLPRIGWARVEAIESSCQVFGVVGDVPAIRA